MQQANSDEWRAQARAYIEEFGSPIVAAREVFLAYAEKAEQTDPRHTVACHAGCWFCCVIPVAVGYDSPDSMEPTAARVPGADYIDLSDLYCADDGCPMVLGNDGSRA